MRTIRHKLVLLRHGIADVLTGPQALAILPLALLGSFWMGGETVFLVAAITLPTLAVLIAIADRGQRRKLVATDPDSIDRAGKSFKVALNAALYRGRLRKTSVLCVLIEMSSSPAKDKSSGGDLTYQNALLLRSLLRRRDRVCVLGRCRYGVVINTTRALSQADAFDVAMRLKTDLEEIDTVDGSAAVRQVRIGISFSTGAERADGALLIRSATDALRTARAGTSAPVTMHVPKAGSDENDSGLDADLEAAFAQHQFVGWFQPQVCTKTGRVSGFETLARWQHPERGVISPSEFMPLLEQRGLMPRLQKRMLGLALDGFEAWRGLSDETPCVALNVTQDDLSDISFPDRIMWELDRRDIDPQNLNIEVLETVISKSEDDTVARNIQRLSDMGCRIDLDDFGTGHASISSLKQFALHRIKIDRSFVLGVENNAEQRKMVQAILTMADQLDLDTLAEGVESDLALSVLAELGCGHAQGYAIARPMPLDRTLSWLAARETDRLGSEVAQMGAA